MIIITVPHSVCIDSVTRTCDIAAEIFADVLASKLNNSKVIKSKNNRMILDDNRFMTGSKSIVADSYLWDELRRTARDSGYGNVTVLDVHSFPKNVNKSFDDNDIVLIDNYPFQNITQELKAELQKNNIQVALVQASTGQNSILDVLTLHPVYFPTILIELNEKYKGDLNKINQISQVIANFLDSQHASNGIQKTYKFAE